METVDEFRTRARTWLESGGLPRLPEGERWDPLADDDDHASRARELQKMIWDGGFAGICYPTEYGGLGLTVEHQRAFDAETCEIHEMPFIFSTPTHSICGPTLLDCATETQKQRHIPPMLRGEELWVQFMSEPSGGSDMAGALTTATRDGEVFLLNGSKVWSTYAYRADYAICLARTDWSRPKHRGLSMFIVPIHDPRTTIVQIEMIDGNKEFCQEYFDDVEIPLGNVVGEVNDGWTVASRLLFHEKTTVGRVSPYVSVPYRDATDTSMAGFVALARAGGRIDDPDARRKIGQIEMLLTVQAHLTGRIGSGLKTKYFPDQAGAIARLFSGTTYVERANIGLDLAGPDAVVWEGDDDRQNVSMAYLLRQARCIGGGTIEMARNVVSERILGMPREYAADKDVAFGDVKRGR